MTHEEETLLALLRAASGSPGVDEVSITYRSLCPDSANVAIQTSWQYFDRDVALAVLRQFFAEDGWAVVKFESRDRTCGCKTCDYGATFTMEFEVKP